MARRSVTLSAGLQVEDPFTLELQKAGATGSTAAAVTDLELPSTCSLQTRTRAPTFDWSKVVVPWRRLLSEYWLGVVP